MDSIFYWASKLFWLLVSQDSLLLIWFGVGFFLVWREKNVWAKRELGVLLFLMMMVGFFPVGERLLCPLEIKYPYNQRLDGVDGIIFLAGPEDPVHTKIWKQIVVGGATERNLESMRLVGKYPDAKLVFTGGVGNMPQQESKTADMAKRLFAEQGMDISRITFERESRNTWENALLSKDLVKPEPDENWV